MIIHTNCITMAGKPTHYMTWLGSHHTSYGTTIFKCKICFFGFHYTLQYHCFALLLVVDSVKHITMILLSVMFPTCYLTQLKFTLPTTHSSKGLGAMAPKKVMKSCSQAKSKAKAKAQPKKKGQSPTPLTKETLTGHTRAHEELAGKKFKNPDEIIAYMDGLPQKDKEQIWKQ